LRRAILSGITEREGAVDRERNVPDQQNGDRPGIADLERLPWTFSQQRLLTSKGFRDECARRGTRVWDVAYLEALHREGLFLPLVRREGDQVEDVATVPFQAWSSYSPSSLFLYSPYQLLAAPALRRLMVGMHGSRSATGKITVKIDLTHPDLRFHLPRLPSRDLTITLSALEARYRPGLVHRLHASDRSGLQSWWDYVEAFDPQAMLTWLGWQPDELKQAAYKLFGEAYSIDPLERWRRLVRLANPDAWSSLKDDALGANDHRIAGEILLRFYEDLVDREVTPPLEKLPAGHSRFWHPLDERLNTDREELEQVLTEFGLSPHPSVVLAIEGKTEKIHLPGVLKLLAPPELRSRIRHVNMQSVDRDLTLLAVYVAGPLVGAPDGDGWLPLQRPPTRLVVAVDPENRYETLKKCAKERRNLVKVIDATLRLEGIAVAWSDLKLLVEVRTWGTHAFEFANFTDQELATAVLAQCRPDKPATVKDLTTAFSEIRKTSPVIDPISAHLGRKVDKTALAKALQPVLEEKVRERAQAANFEDVPFAAAVWRAVELAEEPRRNVVVQPAK